MRELPPTTCWGIGRVRALLTATAIVVMGTMAPRAGADVPIVPASLPLTPASLPLTPDSLPLTLRSSAPIPALIRVTPAATDRLVALATADGHIEARSIDDPATAKWTTPLPNVLSLAAGDGVFYVSTTDGVTALEADTGHRRWANDHHAQGAPLIWRQGVLFVSAADGVMAALRTTDGSEIWHASLGGPLAAPPSSDGALIVASLVNHQVVALAAADGHRAWSSTLDATTVTVQFPIVAPHFAPAGGIVRFQGVQILKVVAPGPLLVANGRVYVFGDDGVLYFLDAKTGLINTRADKVGGRKVGPPAVDARHVFVATVDGVLAAYDSVNGALDRRKAQKSAAKFGALVDRGLVFVPLDSGDVQGLLSETLDSVARLTAPPAAETNVQLSVAPVLSGTGASLRIVTITDTSQSWSMGVYGAAHLTVTPLRSVPGRPLLPPGTGGTPAPR